MDATDGCGAEGDADGGKRGDDKHSDSVTVGEATAGTERPKSLSFLTSGRQCPAGVRNRVDALEDSVAVRRPGTLESARLDGSECGGLGHRGPGGA
jgi:hypothetical protein